MKDNNILSWVTSGITILTGIVAEDVIRVVLLVIGVISALVSLAYNIYVWWHKAKADGKIDKDEVDELKQIIDNHLPNKEDKKDGD